MGTLTEECWVPSDRIGQVGVLGCCTDQQREKGGRRQVQRRQCTHFLDDNFLGGRAGMLHDQLRPGLKLYQHLISPNQHLVAFMSRHFFRPYCRKA